MEEQHSNEESQEEVSETSNLHKVTPLSKYLSMVLFVSMPFIGGWIGYTYAPEKVVEVERVVVEEVEKEINIEMSNVETSYTQTFPLSTEMLFAMNKVMENEDENKETHIVVLNELDIVVGSLIVHKYNTSSLSGDNWHPDQVVIGAGLDYVTSPLESGIYKLAYIEFTNEKTKSSDRDFPVLSFEGCYVADDEEIFCDWDFEGEFYKTSILDVIKDKEFVKYVNSSSELMSHYENSEYGFALDYPKNWYIEENVPAVYSSEIITINNLEFPQSEGDKPSEYISFYVTDEEECSKTRGGNNDSNYEIGEWGQSMGFILKHECYQTGEYLIGARASVVNDSNKGIADKILESVSYKN